MPINLACMRNRVVVRAGTTLTGVVLGATLAGVELAFLLVSSAGLLPVVALPRSRPRVVGLVIVALGN